MTNEEQMIINEQCMISITATLDKLCESKPDDRGELARRYAVTITELEKAYAYFYTWVIEDMSNGTIRPDNSP